MIGPMIDAWVQAAIDRHTRSLTRPEFLKAVRALSARYVERRAEITRRSPTDSAGKQAAFAGFFAPLHFLTARHVATALDLVSTPVDTIVDLGCGTGVTSAAWALAQEQRPRLRGVDRQRWALEEARWNWRQLGLEGVVACEPLTKTTASLVARAATRQAARPPGVCLGWVVNELDSGERTALLAGLETLASQGAAILILEPLSRAVSPWWDTWHERLRPAGARADEWKFDAALPSSLRDLDEAAGFDRTTLSARSLYLGPSHS